MSPSLFWVDAIGAAGQTVDLDGPEGRHAVAVTRIAVGHTIFLADGRGVRALCEVVELSGKSGLRAQVRERTEYALPTPTVTVVQALPKSERSELAVELLTEAGADRIVPWQASRCVSRWAGPKAEKGVGKWRNAAAAAAKQSRRPWIPEVDDLASTADVVALISEACAGGAVAGVLHEESAQPLASLAVDAAPEVIMVVGPEGGVSDDELAQLTEAGASPVILGPQVLRTSTAGAVALGALGVLTQRWTQQP